MIPFAPSGTALLTVFLYGLCFGLGWFIAGWIVARTLGRIP